MSNKIKVLYLSASPRDQSPLKSDAEFRQIFEKLDRRYFEISSCSKMKAADLVDVLSREKPQIVHFSGHGSPEELILEDGLGESSPVQKNVVIELFRNLFKKPQIIFLNACWTANNLESLSQVVDYVVATKKRVLDHAAIDFAVSFYTLLAQEPVENAFNLSRIHFQIGDSENQIAMYVLFVGDGAKDNVLANPSKKTKKRKNGNTVTNTINIGEGNKIKKFNPTQSGG
jgi:hypothetical protein